MKQVNIHEAKTNLSALIREAVEGEPFIIAKSGRPLVVVQAIEDLDGSLDRIGFMPELVIPDGFDDVASDELLALFYGETQ